ncbi:hypothetical protein ACS0TY_034442 [Phlomoides rotata]
MAGKSIPWRHNITRKFYNLVLRSEDNEDAIKIIEESLQRDSLAIDSLCCTESVRMTKGRDKRAKGHFEMSNKKRGGTSTSVQANEFVRCCCGIKYPQNDDLARNNRAICPSEIARVQASISLKEARSPDLPSPISEAELAEKSTESRNVLRMFGGDMFVCKGIHLFQAKIPGITPEIDLDTPREISRQI